MMSANKNLFIAILLCYNVLAISAQDSMVFVELNCENLFDCRHDSLKDDYEFLPEGSHHWTPSRYWHHQNNIAQTILSTSQKSIPDLVALCEVENDSVLFDLTHRSLLRNAGYEYVMTNSPDPRGIDVALLYSPLSFRLENSYPIRITPLKNMRPTRDILYAVGQTNQGSRLHVFVLHAPSRTGGEMQTRPFRKAVTDRLQQSVDSVFTVEPQANIIIAGDFNDYRPPVPRGMIHISASAKGTNGALGTYKYQREWGSLDHIFISPSLNRNPTDCHIADAPFLLTDDKKYGGVKPHRNYLGPKYQRGFSDHLPLVIHFTPCF